MKGFKKIQFLLLSLPVVFSACEKYSYTPLYPPPPAGYYDEVTLGTVYNGNLIVTGNFSALFGSANNIAQWNGSSWQGLGSGVSSNYGVSVINTMTVYDNNLIIAGIYLTNAGGQSVNSIAQWNGSSWQALGSGITGGNDLPSISALVVYNGNLVVGGGYFQNAGGSAAVNLAEWNGSTWQTTLGQAYYTTTYYPYYDYNPVISALAVYNGNLIIGGGFDSIARQYIYNLAQWNGTAWSSVGGRCNGAVNLLVVLNNNLIAIGSFDTIGGIHTPAGSAEWNGTSWSAISSLISANRNTLASPVVYNGDLYYNGFNNYYYADSAMSQWTGSGLPTVIGRCISSKETWYDQGLQTNISPLCVYNGNLIVGGWFTSVNGVSSNYNLAQWNGTNWASF